MRIIETDTARRNLIKQIEGQDMPFTVQVWKGKAKHRTWKQNNLLYLWYDEITIWYADRTSSRVRAELKIQFGIPILRDEDPEFREKYDAKFKGLDYETKVEIIELFEFPVSSIMTTKQFNRYLDTIYEKFTGMGVDLTAPGPPPIEERE